MEASAEDLESNLRLFAMRKAAAASKEFSDLKSRVLVSVQSGPSRNCPMHGGHPMNGRKEMARELRLSAAREAKEAREARERSIEVTSHQSRRGSSLEPLRSYNSMPRRFSASPAGMGPKIGRNGSFQDLGYNNPPLVKKDHFTPRVEFKNTLRQFNPKDDERSRSSLNSNQRSRHDSEPLDYHDSNAYFTQQLTAHNPYAQNPKRNYIEHNSGPASLPIINTKSKLRLDLSSRPQTPKSPTGSRPQSPRRVEFSDEIFFDFGRHNVQRSNSSDLPASLVTKAKPILRNTTSDSLERVITHSSRSNNGFINTSESNLSLIEQYEQQQGNHSLPEPLSPLVIEHTNLESSANCSEDINRRKLSNDDSLVQIYVPENNHESDDETLSNGSQDTIVKKEVKRTMSAEVTSDKQRKVPPMLNEWNRSQSFPPPKNLSLFESDGLQKLSSKDDGKTQN